jgi:hypothetical protein
MPGPKNGYSCVVSWELIEIPEEICGVSSAKSVIGNQ